MVSGGRFGEKRERQKIRMTFEPCSVVRGSTLRSRRIEESPDCCRTNDRAKPDGDSSRVTGMEKRNLQLLILIQKIIIHLIVGRSKLVNVWLELAGTWKFDLDSGGSIEIEITQHTRPLRVERVRLFKSVEMTSGDDQWMASGNRRSEDTHKIRSLGVDRFTWLPDPNDLTWNPFFWRTL